MQSGRITINKRWVTTKKKCWRNMAVNNEKQCKILYKPDSLSKLLSLFLYIKTWLGSVFSEWKKTVFVSKIPQTFQALWKKVPLSSHFFLRTGLIWIYFWTKKLRINAKNELCACYLQVDFESLAIRWNYSSFLLELSWTQLSAKH